ncbi:hypothetical protein BABINDRAFT_19811, partial [Babjeviella inositovora NRRL Y-12698]
TEEQKEFNTMALDRKLERLKSLVKQSQVFSNIIAETLFAGSVTKVEEAPKKRGRPKQNAQTGKTGTRAQPRSITGCTMREYQLEGMDWLITLYENGLNGILADEMGLGKTIQAISMIAFLHEQGIRGPFLIVAPLSTTGNWVKELARFAPDMPVLQYTGDKNSRARLREKHFRTLPAVVVTSYELAILDRVHLNKFDWKYLVVDEGHRLKNSKCLLFQELKKLRVGNRLLLTGTPLQNNLNELWSLLNFILPDIFHDLALFQQWFDFSSLESLSDDTDNATKQVIDAEIQKNLVTNLHTIMKPFLLRRLKSQVMGNVIPPKREYIVYAHLADEQRVLYKAALAKDLKRVVLAAAFQDRVKLNRGDYTGEQPEVEEVVVDRGDPVLDEIYTCTKKEVEKMKFGNLMMKLRLICNSPYMYYFPWSEDTPMDSSIYANSGKMQLLDQLVPRLLQEDHRVLIFSQFTGMLDLIQDWCDHRGHAAMRIDGATAQDERQAQIDEFTESNDIKVFLLSTRAGGLGINLTAADSVILFDSDWNPQVDLQAMDRVHRIGQTKPVVVYRFATANTIEQILLSRADSKRKLEKLVIQMGSFGALSKLASSDGNFGSTVHAASERQLVAELSQLLLTKGWGNMEHVDDSRLSEEELAELLDRSPKAYQSREIAFKHVALFETVNALE